MELVTSESEPRTIMVENMAASKQAWHWSSSLELTSQSTSTKHTRWLDRTLHACLSAGLIPSGRDREQGCSESFELLVSVFASV